MFDSLNTLLSKRSVFYENDSIADSKDTVQHISACLSCPQQPSVIQTEIGYTLTQTYSTIISLLNTTMLSMQTIEIFKLLTTETPYQSEVALTTVPTKKCKRHSLTIIYSLLSHYPLCDFCFYNKLQFL